MIGSPSSGSTQKVIEMDYNIYQIRVEICADGDTQHALTMTCVNWVRGANVYTENYIWCIYEKIWELYTREYCVYYKVYIFVGTESSESYPDPVIQPALKSTIMLATWQWGRYTKHRYISAFIIYGITPSRLRPPAQHDGADRTNAAWCPSWINMRHTPEVGPSFGLREWRI